MATIRDLIRQAEATGDDSVLDCPLALDNGDGVAYELEFAGVTDTDAPVVTLALFGTVGGYWNLPEIDDEEE